MSYEAKTKPTQISVDEFLKANTSDQKLEDSYTLIDLMERLTGHKANMWGPSIVGFGSYHYKYDSGHEGDSCILGFSPRKAAISLYVFMPTTENEELLKNLGKYKMGKACIYIKKLADIDLKILEKISLSTINYITEKYPINTTTN